MTNFRQKLADNCRKFVKRHIIDDEPVCNHPRGSSRRQEGGYSRKCLDCGVVSFKADIPPRNVIEALDKANYDRYGDKP